MLKKLLNLFTSETPSRDEMSRRAFRAGWDAAKTTSENHRHWANADLLTADAAADPHTRAKLRSRARYEAANNCYARGLVDTLAHSTIGRGPTLQVMTDDAEANRQIEAEWRAWSRRIDLARKLRLMRTAISESGEIFGLFTDNPRLPGPVKLDVRLIEADQVADPAATNLTDPNSVDGIVVDDFGNVRSYQLLKRHPGDTRAGFMPTEAEPIPASQMLHLANAPRPGQIRGIPEITPALPLFAMLRRYGLAVVNAAENAAAIAGTIQTNSAPEDGPEPVEPMDTFEMERGTWLTMPSGWVANQLRAEQPTNQHSDFVNSIIQEIARCLEVPFIIAAGTSAGSNFASGKLDMIQFRRRISILQRDIEHDALDRIFRAWLAEASLVEGLLPQAARLAEPPDHEWMWEGTESIDPVRDANAQKTRLKAGTSTLATEYARAGKDWERELRQRAREVALEKELLGTADADEEEVQ